MGKQLFFQLSCSCWPWLLSQSVPFLTRYLGTLTFSTLFVDPGNDQFGMGFYKFVEILSHPCHGCPKGVFTGSNWTFLLVICHHIVYGRDTLYLVPLMGPAHDDWTSGTVLIFPRSCKPHAHIKVVVSPHWGIIITTFKPHYFFITYKLMFSLLCLDKLPLYKAWSKILSRDWLCQNTQSPILPNLLWVVSLALLRKPR